MIRFFEEGIPSDVSNTIIGFVIGLAILIIGAIKFFAPYHGGGKPLIPIFGDFLPSILAILSGVFISVDFLESLKKRKDEEAAPKTGTKKVEGFWSRTKSVLQRYQYPIGFASMFFGLLHWFLFSYLQIFFR